MAAVLMFPKNIGILNWICEFFSCHEKIVIIGGT